MLQPKEIGGQRARRGDKTDMSRLLRISFQRDVGMALPRRLLINVRTARRQVHRSRGSSSTTLAATYHFQPLLHFHPVPIHVVAATGATNHDIAHHRNRPHSVSTRMATYSTPACSPWMLSNIQQSHAYPLNRLFTIGLPAHRPPRRLGALCGTRHRQIIFRAPGDIRQGAFSSNSTGLRSHSVLKRATTLSSIVRRTRTMYAMKLQ
ncbi:hypothetical protein LXA43DRAFT_1035154 [Ganoderma leucocontextum]|nr:hypothetical protein LXA43DRAFT_1035154 [Ganoderma leucocontextum]